jgi:hypothetical protein
MLYICRPIQKKGVNSANNDYTDSESTQNRSGSTNVMNEQGMMLTSLNLSPMHNTDIKNRDNEGLISDNERYDKSFSGSKQSNFSRDEEHRDSDIPAGHRYSDDFELPYVSKVQAFDGDHDDYETS